MKKVLEIHNYEVSEYDPDKGIWVEPSKSEEEQGIIKNRFWPTWVKIDPIFEQQQT